MMYNKEESSVPNQEPRNSRSRHSDGIVPAVCGSLSNDGPCVTCPAGVAQDDTPAMTGAEAPTRKGDESPCPGPSRGHRGRLKGPRRIISDSETEGEDSVGGHQHPSTHVKARPGPAAIPGDKPGVVSQGKLGLEPAETPLPRDADSDSELEVVSEKLSGAPHRHIKQQWQTGASPQPSQPLVSPKRTNTLRARRRGRGRPPTTGEYVGLAEAKRRLVEETEREMQLRAEQELAEEFDAIRVTTRSAAPSQPSSSLNRAEDTRGDPPRRLISREMPTSQVVEQAAKMAEKIRNMAAKSGRLKGTYIRWFKEAATGLEEAVGIVAGRMDTSEEVHRLTALNTKLSAEVSSLREKVVSLESEKGAVQARFDSVLKENGRLQGEVDAVHEELRDMRKEIMSLKMARLKETRGRNRPAGRPAPPSPPPSQAAQSRMELEEPPEPPPSASPSRELLSGATPSSAEEGEARESGGPCERPNESASRSRLPSPEVGGRGPRSLKDLENRVMDAMRSQLSIFWEQLHHRFSRPSLGAEKGVSSLRASTGGNSSPARQAEGSNRTPHLKEKNPSSEKKGKKKKKKTNKKNGRGEKPKGGEPTNSAGGDAPSTRARSDPPQSSSTQLCLPPPPRETWSQVVGRKKKKDKRAQGPVAAAPAAFRAGGKPTAKPGKRPQ
ncbi:serine/arginine repetitive matrix protein 1-like [Pseudomyrmex gracilis]|uniref:serine/arginine repetitive matrix protein 1-like n=1 Tax=Pseudomyrmex gracilis TaxID=219809 RepID=UPI0009957C36|nr:serine/arginine repetitive matrix protein 1-like [Pseudomyrmex gracilis]